MTGATGRLVEGSRLLVTGGAGFLGAAVVRAAVARGAAEVVVLSRGELDQQQLARSLRPGAPVRLVIGDVRDERRVEQAMREVDAVVHTAALKHVQVGELHPTEFVRTNTLGTHHVVEAARDHGVRRLVAVSTDKACLPTSAYGASKLAAERVVLAADLEERDRAVGRPGTGGTRSTVVRCGNLLGADGSLVALLRRAVATGASAPTLTDRRCTRFLLTRDEVARVVLDAVDGREGLVGGEVVVPAARAARLVDLVEAVAPGLAWRETGLRPGERLHEELCSPDELDDARRLADHLLVLRADDPRRQELPGAEGFAARSEHAEPLTVPELRALLAADR